MKSLIAIVIIAGIIFKPVASIGQEKTVSSELKVEVLGETKNVHAYGPTLLAGQPSEDDFKKVAERGIKTVVTLRTEEELDWNEAKRVKDLGLDFHRFAIKSPETLTHQIFDETLGLLANPDKSPVLLHCASANRVGAIWLAHRVLNDGISVEAAQKEAKTVGLKTPALEEKALEYIEEVRKKRKQPSAKPGINDTFLDPQLDVSDWIGKFEIESREVYGARERVLDTCNLKPGMKVADIGAGTGFYSRLFASEVGETGWVYAVDISPRFLEHINQQSEDDQIKNLTCVLGTERSIRLAEDLVDLVFICDTYHHFEYPPATLASIHRALKPDGELIVIDFERIPGKSREFILGHVRAGKAVFQKEITQAGFEFVEEVQIPAFQENYLLRFRKN